MREIAEMLSIRTKFLGIKTEMIGIPQQLFKQKLGSLQFAGTGKTFDVPERTGRKVSFSTGEAVHMGAFYRIATDQSVFDESFF